MFTAISELGLPRSFAAAAAAALLLCARSPAAEPPLCPPAAEEFPGQAIPWGSNGQSESFSHPHGWRYVLSRAEDIAGAWDAVPPGDQLRLLRAAAALSDDRRLGALSDSVVYGLYLSTASSARLSYWAGPEFALGDYLAKKPFISGAAPWDETGARRLHDEWRKPPPARREDREGLADRVRSFPLLEEAEIAFDRLWWSAVSSGIASAETGGRLLAELGPDRPVFMLGSAMSAPAEYTDGGSLIRLRAVELRSEMVLQRPDEPWSFETAGLRDQLASDGRGFRLPPGWAVMAAHELVHHCVDRGFPVSALRTNALLTASTRLEERYAQAVSMRLQMELLVSDPDALDPAMPFAVLLRRALKEFLADDEAYFSDLKRGMEAEKVREEYLRVMGTGLLPDQERVRDRALKLFDEQRRYLERGLAAQRAWVKQHELDARIALAGAEAEQVRGPDAGFMLVHMLEELRKLASRVPPGPSASKRLLDRTALKISRRFVAETRRALDDPELAEETVKWVRPFQNILGRLGVAEPKALTGLSAEVYAPE